MELNRDWHSVLVTDEREKEREKKLNAPAYPVGKNSDSSGGPSIFNTPYLLTVCLWAVLALSWARNPLRMAAMSSF